MVNRAYENNNLEFVNNQDAHSQIENDKTGEPIYGDHREEQTEQSSQAHESKSASGDFMPKILTNDKTAANIRSLIKKQCIVFNVLHQWARNYVKNVSSKKSSD